MYDDLLVPTDGSDKVAAALDHALELATTYEATVHALYVVDDSRGNTGLMGVGGRDPLEPLRKEGEAAVEAVASQAREAGVDVTTAVRQHTPHEGIRDHAAEQDVDLIIMGSRGHAGLWRALFGSVTERVLRVTDRPVLVVGSGASDPASG